MNAMAKLQEQPAEFRPWQHGAIFLVACAILVSRRPDAILNAQFFQEDGHVWFADAYNFGWWAGLFRTYEGYHHVFLRLGASLALLVPLTLAPLVLNLIAICIQALPANLLVSVRCSAWGSLRFRALLAGVYLALPNTREMLNDISQSQWPLTLCAFLLLAGSTPRSVGGRIFDISILLLCGLTGPECFFLLPIALFLAWRHRDRWRWVATGVLAALCPIQAWSLLNGGFSSRPHYPLGASPAMLTRILAGDVYLGTLLGGNGLAASMSTGVFLFLAIAAVIGTAIAAFCFARSAMEMRLFLLLTSTLLAASLISPTAYPPVGVSVWELLAGAAGIRLWYFPTLAFAWSILWCFQSPDVPLKIVSAVLLCVMCFGIVRDWRYPPLKDLQFKEYVKRFEAAPPGTAFIFPQNPQGWNMTLVKHPSSR
jgi:hypothetical protein